MITALSACTAITMNTSETSTLVSDEHSFQQAIALANADSNIRTITFLKDAYIRLSTPVTYTGSQALILIGNNATIDGAATGVFYLDNYLTAVTEDGTLIFNTTADITIHQLSVVNNATRGIVIRIPDNATGDDIVISLHHVIIRNSALYGLHIDDNADDCDDGSEGSEIGINLNIFNSSFIGNGTGAIDFDGIRVDERARGGITATIKNTHIDSNGGDGIELDEAGAGDVKVIMVNVTTDNNGFFDSEDFDDGFDIDEADDGDINVTLTSVQALNNMDEALDFDEQGNGDVILKFDAVTANNNFDEAIKIDEENAGSISADFSLISITKNGDDGIQFTESGEGTIKASLKKITAINNARYGIKMEQWLIEDEPVPAEEPGELISDKIFMQGNKKGDEIKTNNITMK